VTVTDAGRKVIFGPGRVRVSGTGARGIVAAPPPLRSPGEGHGSSGGHGKGQNGEHGQGRGGGNSLAALAQAFGAISATGAVVVPSPDVGTTWYSGSSAPPSSTSSFGALGDWYFNTANRDTYLKEIVTRTAAYDSHGTILQSGAPANVAVPSTLSAGDLMILQVNALNTNLTGAPTLTPPPGWTRINARGTFSANLSASTDLFYKIAGASESAVALAFNMGASIEAVIVRVVGNALSSPIEVQAGASSAVSTSISTPSVTPTTNNDLVVSLVCGAYDGAVSFTAPSGYNLRFQDNYVSQPLQLGWADNLINPAAPTGALSWASGVAAGSRTNWGHTFAILGAGATPSWVRVGALAA